MSGETGTAAVVKAVNIAASRRFDCHKATMRYIDGGREEAWTFTLSNGKTIEISVPARTTPQALAERLVSVT